MPQNRPRRARAPRPFAASDNSVRAARQKLGRVLLSEREPLRRRLEKLEQEFEKLARARAKEEEAREKQRAQGDAASAPAGEKPGAKSQNQRSSVSFVDWEEKLQILMEDCDASIAKVDKRRRSIPKITYDSTLPVVERREEIAKLIRDNQVVVLCGETGSGKSTQLPKICLELGLGARGMIGHTQPRRIAARSIAQRVADELKTPLGKSVGYKIRFTDETSEDTLVKLMTDGVLLAESQSDRYFNRYEVIIVDEAHERSLNVDFLLGMLKRVLRVRRDLKVIITSATIDAARFADHFRTPKGPAPVVEVSGRTYPIDIQYRPVDELKQRREEAALARGVAFKPQDLDDEDAFEATLLDAVDELARKGKGDMLVFMPTERDIFETAKLLKSHSIPGDDAARKTLILPLYARLPSEEQQKIFGKIPHRKIVIATNVAESSLTVPGIRYVIDTGTARISRYSPRSMTQRLPVEPVSRASADQRAGRCGRVGPGVCIRLYSERDYLARPKYATPEIQRSNLASVILQTKALRLGEVERFPFIDPPHRAAIEDGYRTLYELGASDENRELTPMGRTMSRLPLDPRIARIILAASEEGALRDVLPIAAALEIQDPRERPREKQEAADLKHAPFQDENSDFLSYLKLWDFWQSLKDKTTRSQLRKACRENFLSYNRMKEWSDIYVQLLQIARELKLNLGERKNDYDRIHRSLLTGLLYGIALKSDVSNEYTSTNAGKFIVWPGSGLKKKPQWIVAAERLETSRSYLRTAARINPDWIEEIGARLIKRTHKEPFWNRETGYVHAYERATLYGLAVVPKRRINYGPIDPEKSRQIFIYEALVNREFDCTLPFFEHNGKVEEEAKRLRDKLRKYDFIKSQDAIYDFYDARIPATVYDAVTLRKWRNEAKPGEMRSLFATLTDFCAADEIDESAAEEFPDEFELTPASQLPIEYKFNPGGEDDGLSLVAPIEALRQLDSGRLGWLVPGLLEEKVVALLKSLPKEIRRELVPVPDTAREICKGLDFGSGRLEEILAREISRRIGRAVSPDEFDQDRLPLELQFNVKVVDAAGTVVAEGRRPEELRRQLGVEMSRSLDAVRDPKWTRDGIKSWDFGDLPKSVAIARGGLTAPAYPGLCDPRFFENDFARDSAAAKTVSLRLFDSKDKALRSHVLGVRRLFTLEYLNDLRTQARWFPDVDRLRVYAHSIKGFDFDVAAAELIACRALDIDIVTAPEKEAEFKKLSRAAAERIAVAVQELVGWFKRFLESYHEARLVVEKFRNGPARDVAEDASLQIERLLTPGFWVSTPWEWLREYPRYFKGIAMRFEKWFNGGAAKDPAMARELREYWSRYEEKSRELESEGVVDLELETFRWAIEEYRVSLFAQKLGAAMKTSPQRLEKIWEKVAR